MKVFCEAGHVEARRQVIQAAEARGLALAQGDADRLTHLLHEDFRWVSHSGETFNRQDYIRRNTVGPVRWQSQELSDVVVTVVGDAAVLHAEVTDVIGSGSRAETFQMPMTQVWVRQNGDWRCLAGHAGPRKI